MIDVFTQRQKQEISAFKRGELKRINLWDGSVRSGKTWITLVIWFLWVAQQPQGTPLIMIGKSITALKRNVLDVLESLIGANNLKYTTATKEGYLFGHKIYLEGANDARSEGKIRGLTLKGAYCDEVSLYPEDFFIMLLSRLSMPEAKIFATTNPDAPTHWLKKNYIDEIENKKLDMRISHFLLDDNTTLEKKYIENLKKEYVGVFYDRFILGKWVAAHGAIYNVFTENEQEYYVKPDELPSFERIIIGIDFGKNKSGHAFTAVGLPADRKNLYVLASEWHKAEGTTPDDVMVLIQMFIDKIEKQHGIVKELYPDCAETTMINMIRSRVNASVYPSEKGAIIDRIRFTTAMMSLRRLKIVKNECKPLIESFKTAVYDDKKLDDVRLDDGSYNVDSLDSMEYACSHYMKQFIRERNK